MNVDQALQELHLRSARGEKLLPEEQSRLDAWYAEMDRQEAEMLARFEPADDVGSLQVQLDAVLAQIILERDRG